MKKSSLTTQLTELSTRLDSMEISIKKDIHSILEALQHPGMTREKSIDTQSDSHHQKDASIAQDKQNLLMTASMQPSDSDVSFDYCLDNKRQQRMPTAGTSQVHRSISQPECTNTTADKNLLR